MSEFSAQDPELLSDFVVESRELIETVDQDLVTLEQSPEDPELLNSIFRALHTIKGASSFLALDPLTHFAHAGEDALNALRKGAATMDAVKMDLLLQAVDVIRGQIEAVEAGQMPEEGPEDLATQLRAIGAGESAQAPEADEASEAGGDKLDLPPEKMDLLPYMVDDLLAGVDQVRGLFGETHASTEGHTLATQIGDVTGGLVRSAEFFDVDSLTADIRFLDQLTDAVADHPAEGRAEIFAAALPLLSIIEGRAAEMRDGRQPSADSSSVCQAIERVINGEAPEPADDAQPVDESDERRSGEDRRQGGDRRVADRRASERQGGGERTVRVDVERLESLLNLVGELVLQKNRVLGLGKLSQRSTCDQELRDQLTHVGSEIERVTSDLQNGVMKTRMQPLSKLFNRYPRLIRDLARSLEKQIDLQIEGGETEVDKSVIESLGDPLVHILRNSADHGVETPDKREAAGKPRQGVIRLSARHEGNHVLVQLADDGAGLDADRIAAKAIEKGLISEEQRQSMSAREIHSLIFEPGFSTAAQVSDVSGRGVGMDVVRTNITKLNGMIDVTSAANEGTTISVRIPLTVAIMPAMVVQIAEEVYAIPLNNIVEIIRPDLKAIRTVGSQPVLRVRDHVLPVVDMTRRLHASDSNERPPIAVVVALGDRQMAMLVSGLHGQEEVVIKPLDEDVERDVAVSGATIREDGSVSLILDVAALFKSVETRPLAAA
jgi:two-component system chemotaxis sensor kinase CheA